MYVSKADTAYRVNPVLPEVYKTVSNYPPLGEHVKKHTSDEKGVVLGTWWLGAQWDTPFPFLFQL